MFQHRVIPVLLLQDKGLVKTVKFKNPKYVGDPINAIRIFNEKEVDELIVLDITASKQKRGPDFSLIEDLASECFMPLGYGGGITRLEEMKRLFYLGIEKVIVNTSALRRPDLINEAAVHFGSQSVVASIDVKKNLWGRFTVYAHALKQRLDIAVVAQARDLEQRGAGEIMLNSVDLDGTMAGYDLALIRQVADAVSIPVIACGGAGKLADFRTAVYEGGASAVAAGSMFVFHGPHRAVLINYPKIRDLETIL